MVQLRKKECCIRARASRLPRRFAPRNDGVGGEERFQIADFRFHIEGG